ncbi:MAG TPA: hypothetical protein VMD59_03610, partial [Acidimicrobiales bacterium]|nr:hypothetical protein [Acidimicrobiales bacterium]
MTELAPAALPPGPVNGVVASFDEAAGLGTLVTATGSVPFHCTTIADGSRRIPSGSRVLATIGPAHLGRLEATL